MGESLGSHSLNSLSDFLQRHIDSRKASSCVTSRAKPIIFVKPMAGGKSAKKGGRQCRDNTAKDMPPDLYEMYKPDPEELHI